MVERVFWHIGLPKTGTTYLQQILWDHQDSLREQGIVLPGAGHRRHLWAALDLQDAPRLERRHPEARGSWEALCAELDAAEGTGILSHEFFCGADADQIARGMQRLQPAEVHLVITARDAASMLAAGWQEEIKNGRWGSLAETAAFEGRTEFGWWVWDLEQVLRRWTAAIPAERIHVLPIPDRAAAPDQHWRNLAQVIGCSADLTLPEQPVNQSLGVVQIEALRLVNQQLEGFGKAFDRGVWIRGYLGEEQLAGQDGERVRLDDALLDDCRARSRRALDLIGQLGIEPVGGTDRLRVQESALTGRTVDSVTSEEVAESVAQLAASMLTDVRRLRSTAAKPTGPVGSEIAAAPGWKQRLRRGFATNGKA